MPKGYDPKIAAFSSVQYVTNEKTSEAFRTAYGEALQTLTEMNPKGVKVQPSTLATWP